MVKFQTIINYLDTHQLKYKTLEKTADLTSFKVGGVANIVVYPESINQLIEVVRLVTDYKCKHFILGNGTNTVFSDNLYDGVIIVTRYIDECAFDGEYLVAQCGATINKACKMACNCSLSGLEFAYGIPGSIGGAVYMNASAFNGSISDVAYECLVFDKESRMTFKLSGNELGFNKKTSIFSTNKSLVLLSATFKLMTGKREEVSKLMAEHLKRRIDSQPLDLPSAGSVFKRPNNHYASRLIDECGLKGMRIGGAEVSKKHAGFIVNVNNATASDVRLLACRVKEIIKEKLNISLEEEIIFVE